MPHLWLVNAPDARILPEDVYIVGTADSSEGMAAPVEIGPSTTTLLSAWVVERWDSEKDWQEVCANSDSDASLEQLFKARMPELEKVETFGSAFWLPAQGKGSTALVLDMHLPNDDLDVVLKASGMQPSGPVFIKHRREHGMDIVMLPASLGLADAQFLAKGMPEVMGLMNTKEALAARCRASDVVALRKKISAHLGVMPKAERFILKGFPNNFGAKQADEWLLKIGWAAEVGSTWKEMETRTFEIRSKDMPPATEGLSVVFGGKTYRIVCVAPRQRVNSDVDMGGTDDKKEAEEGSPEKEAEDGPDGKASAPAPSFAPSAPPPGAGHTASWSEHKRRGDATEAKSSKKRKSESPRRADNQSLQEGMASMQRTMNTLMESMATLAGKVSGMDERVARMEFATGARVKEENMEESPTSVPVPSAAPAAYAAASTDTGGDAGAAEAAHAAAASAGMHGGGI